MAEIRCPNCGRKLDGRTPTGARARCPKCGESLRHLSRNEQPNQGWDKLQKLLEGRGLAPLGSSPAALAAAAAQPAAAAEPAPAVAAQAAAPSASGLLAEVVAEVEGIFGAGYAQQHPEVVAPLLQARAGAEELRALREDLARIEARLAALEGLLRAR